MNLIFTLVAIDHFASPCGLVCATLVSLLIAFLPSSTDGLPLLRPISLFGGLCPISFAWAILKCSLLKLCFGCSNEYCFILIPKNAILCNSPILQHFKVGKRLIPILSEQVISEVRFVPPVTPGECKIFARCVIFCIIKHSLFMFLLLKLLIFCENGVKCLPWKSRHIIFWQISCMGDLSQLDRTDGCCENVKTFIPFWLEYHSSKRSNLKTMYDYVWLCRYVAN